MHRAVAVTLTFTLIPAAGWSIGAWQASSSSREAFTPGAAYGAAAAPSHDAGWSALPVPLLDDPEPEQEQRDLYGNDISDAVAKYKSDRSGSVYEEHSPQTEVARLKPPTT
ncbi:MAG TPA: hypothetical protein VM032_13045 [Vicinamibacterales bacterium]|nr:hypothetical protein [Vicinamibacterales bacterium]